MLGHRVTQSLSRFRRGARTSYRPFVRNQLPELWHGTRKQISSKDCGAGILARFVLNFGGVNMKSLRLLIVDDEEAARYGIRRALESFGYDIAEAESAESAHALMAHDNFDLLLLDVNLPGMSGLEFLKQIQNENENVREAPLVIIITAHGSERLAVQAVKSGAYDYIAKPFELDDLRLVVKNAFETIKLRRENQALRRRIEIETSQRGALLGNSKPIQNVRAMIDKVADTDATVLVRGESGTGKELVARELHDRSTTRSSGAFIAVNCAALPTELIESELFYRLRVVTIDIAPLRERREDIPVLASTFARQAAERHGLRERVIGHDALRLLMDYDWPGNVRELKNVIERAAIMSEGDELSAIDIDQPSAKKDAIEMSTNGNLLVPYTNDFRDDRREFERRYIARCLEESGGNVTRAASVLGMHRQSLQHKLRELGLGRRYVAVGAGPPDNQDK